MYQTYSEIINSCKDALVDFSKTQELLEYPEIQADKAYYLSILEKYNKQQSLHTKLLQLQEALSQEETLVKMLPTLSEEERTLAYDEIALLRNRQVSVAEVLALALGAEHTSEKVFCRLTCGTAAAQVCEQFFALVKEDLLSHNISVQNQSRAEEKNILSEISFVAQGVSAFARLNVLCGVHKVYAQGETSEVALAVTPALQEVKVEEKDIKIDLFHSGGAGGQNINKVETAVRVTHIPTGTVVVCQDERSQLKNKRRALENLQTRIVEQNAETEKKRMDFDIKRQLKCVSALFFDTKGTMTDKRLSIVKAPFPPTSKEFSTYINALISKGN